jgi:TonB family protein
VSVWAARIGIIAFIALVHIVGIKMVNVGERRERPVLTDEAASAFIINDIRNSGVTPLPAIRLTTIASDSDSLSELLFEDSVDTELSEVSGAASAPHLARVQWVSQSTYRSRARVLPAQTATVVLALKILCDGSVSSADVVRSSGYVLADSAAVDYALALRWVPATRQRIPIESRTSFVVSFYADDTQAHARRPRTQRDIRRLIAAKEQ